MINSSLGFVIPVYENMPEEICTRPDILESDYEDDNTKVYADVNTVLNLRTGPSTSYEILTTITRDEIMTRIAKGIQNGERGDKVLLENGMIGYAFQSYIKEYEENEEETPEEMPQEVYVNFNESLKIENNIISGLDVNKLSTSDIKQLIDTNLTIEIYNYKNELLDNDENIGTSSKLLLKDEDGNIRYDYSFIIYGDVNGDGDISSLDNLIIQKHILEINLITNELFLQAANISKNGEEPTSLDILKIQKHILEINFIEQ